MNEQTKEKVNSVAKIAFPTLGALGLLGTIVAGGGLCLVSLLGVLFFYEPGFFGLTFAIGFLVAAMGTFELSRRCFGVTEREKLRVKAGEKG